MDLNEPWTRLADDGNIVMRGNILKGPWESKEEYLRAHWEMFREEATTPLREAVKWVREYPDAPEDLTFGGNLGIYSRVGFLTRSFMPTF